MGEIDESDVLEETDIEETEMVEDELSDNIEDESEVENVLDNPLEITTTEVPTTTEPPTTTTIPTTTTPYVPPCSNSAFGCCENSKNFAYPITLYYPSHGPRQEGCRLSASHGCCPDFITPASGPHYKGRDCANSEFGCCKAPELEESETNNLNGNIDNETSISSITSTKIIGKSARDENKKGCGCLLTPHGCCPDRYTVAKGSDVATYCPCDTQDYGCCPDGVTPAQGPQLEGCKGCEDSEFGCCADNKTPANDSDKSIGCDCSSSKFGCCPDGISFAEGDNFTGCDEIPGEECHIPKDIGTCVELENFKENYTRRYFFDLMFGACSPFYWSGDCSTGNETEDSEKALKKLENNFLDLKSCKNKCVSPVGSGRCYLPKVVGPGRAALDRWYYDVETNECTNFTYGGLLGNTNNFESENECARTCEANVKDLSVCLQPMDAGPCRGEYLRWYYDEIEGSCKEFNFTGCKGNLNRFMSKDNCENSCKHESKKVRSKFICALSKPSSDGYCEPEDMKAKWYFNKGARLCEPFYYGNCKPGLNISSALSKSSDQNTFDTQDECERVCPNTFPPEISIKQENYTVEVKQEVILQISVNSNPPSQISWEFNGEAVEGGNTEQLEDGSLKITEVSMENTGVWVVMANNDVESIMRKEIYLQVDPERTNITMTLDKSKTSFIAGTSIVLSCAAEGFPYPEIKWYKNNTPLKNSKKVSINGTSLAISKSQSIDKGVYKCTASNKYESQSDEVAVTVEAPQGEPVEICEDDPTLANCEMIVRANWCFVGRFPEICCKSCKESGASPPPPTAPPPTTSAPPTTEGLETIETTDGTEIEEGDNLNEESEISTTPITETTEAAFDETETTEASGED